MKKKYNKKKGRKGILKKKDTVVKVLMLVLVSLRAALISEGNGVSLVVLQLLLPTLPSQIRSSS